MYEIYFCQGTLFNTQVDGPLRFKSLKTLAKEIEGYNTKKKQTSYFIRGKALRRNDKSVETIDWIFIDGDSSLDNMSSAPSAKKVHSILKGLQIPHIIYPSFSNSKEKHRYRIMIPVKEANRNNWKDYVNHITYLIQTGGAKIRPVRENYVISQPWFITGPIDEEYRFKPLVFEKKNSYYIQKAKPETPVGSTFSKKGKSKIKPFNHISLPEPSQAEINILNGLDLHFSCFTLIRDGWNKNAIIALLQSGKARSIRGERVDKLIDGKEIEDIEKWYSAIDDDEIDYSTMINGYLMNKNYISEIGETEWIVKNILISSHVCALIAPPNGGKTTITFYKLVEEMVHLGYEVNYIDMDSPPEEHKRMYEYSKKIGFNLIAPDTVKGLSIESFLNDLEKLSSSSNDLSKKVFIFDTLKKCANLMMKDSTKKFFRIVKRLSVMGATCLLLGHSNKHPDKDGNLVFEGVGDVRSDVDDLLYLYSCDHDEGVAVTTYPDKKRGIFEKRTFIIDSLRRVSDSKEIIPAKERSKHKGDILLDHLIMKIEEAISQGRKTQSQIVEYVTLNTSFGKNKVLTALKVYSEEGFEDQRFIEERTGQKHNAVNYKIFRKFGELKNDHSKKRKRKKEKD